MEPLGRIKQAEDYINQRRVGRVFDRVMDGVYKVTGIDWIVKNLDNTGFFDSTQYDGDHPKASRNLKSTYLGGGVVTILGCVVDPLVYIVAGGTILTIGLLAHRSRRENNESISPQYVPEQTLR